jgi:hypothetical protein
MKKHYFDKVEMKHKMKNMMLSYKEMILIDKTQDEEMLV